jgi:hypothetical protein
LITEVESAEGPDGPDGPEEAGAAADVVDAVPGGPGKRPWAWALGAVVVTSAAWALTLQGIGYGEASPPDLHHYRLSDNPCGGFNLKPLADAFGITSLPVGSAVIGTGPALDTSQCDMAAQAPVAGTRWKMSYSVTVTVELHKKTDPAAEFEDRNRPHGPGFDSSTVTSADATDRVTPVPHLGDEAYLLVGDDTDRALTVLHGGAVFVIDVAAVEQWADPAHPPPDTDGYPQQPPSLKRLDPALIATMRRIMSALSS